MFKQLFMLLSVSYLLPIACAEPDNTQKLLSRMPTILREICKENMKVDATGNLLVCMDSTLTSKEKLQKIEQTSASNLEYMSHGEYNNVLRKNIYFCIGTLMSGGLGVNIKKDGRDNRTFISPSTVVRIADELCEWVFFAKPVSEHPYDEKEELDNWLLSSEKFPKRFAVIFERLMKKYWKEMVRGGELRGLATSVYSLRYPEKELLFVVEPQAHLYYEDMMGHCVKNIVERSRFFEHGSDANDEDLKLVPGWTQQIIAACDK